MKPNRLTLLILLNLSLVLTAGQSPDYDSIFRDVHTRIERQHAIREPHLIAAISTLTAYGPEIAPYLIEQTKSERYDQRGWPFWALVCGTLSNVAADANEVLNDLAKDEKAYLHAREYANKTLEGQWPPAAAKIAPIPVKGYRLAWSDEFTGRTLDTDKWIYRGLGPRRDAVNVKETVTLDGKGLLTLTTRRNNDRIETAMIATQGKYETTFGYFECRFQLQTQEGHWSAFWMQSPTLGQPVGDPAKGGCEIDIFEYLRKRGDVMQHTLHWDGYGPDHKSARHLAEIPGLTQGWHTIGLLWTKDKYTFYIDGKQTWECDQGVSGRDQYMILSLEVGTWAGDIKTATLPDNFIIDYVRVYKKNP